MNKILSGAPHAGFARAKMIFDLPGKTGQVDFRNLKVLEE